MDLPTDRLDYPPEPPSLAQRVGAAWRTRGERRAVAAPVSAKPAGDRRFGILLALLLPAGPLLTCVAAKTLASVIDVRTEAARRAAAPVLAPRAAVIVEHRVLEDVVLHPRPAEILNAFARALPPEARLESVGVDREGAAFAEVTSPDPDALRVALRRDPLTARLFDAGQRRGDGGIIVKLRGELR